MLWWKLPFKSAIACRNIGGFALPPGTSPRHTKNSSICPTPARSTRKVASVDERASADRSIRVRRGSSGRRRRRHAPEDSIRLIREAGGVEERRQGLIGVTVTEHQRPQAGDGQCSAVSDGERAHGGRQRGAVGSEDIYPDVAK